MKILLHSSKTMKSVGSRPIPLTVPVFRAEAVKLHDLLAAQSTAELMRLMKISGELAGKVKEQLDAFSTTKSSAAVLTFRGDIYSGLAAEQWSREDAAYAQQHLVIMSGLYGLLRPYDGVQPYRLEMGYSLKVMPTVSLWKYWQGALQHALDPNDVYVNLTAYEYFKTVEKSLANAQVITPKFLTVSPKTGQPTFVTVHAKIARGAFANWMVRNKIQAPESLQDFNVLGYRFSPEQSTTTQPVYVCTEFGGLGLSVRLK